MPRVIDDEVKAVIETNKDVSPFIETANLIVNEELANAGLTAARLRQIELYLAAHLLAITEERGGLTFKGQGTAREVYSDVFGQGLQMTRFGQTVMTLDKSGILASIGTGKQPAEFEVY